MMILLDEDCLIRSSIVVVGSTIGRNGPCRIRNQNQPSNLQGPKNLQILSVALFVAQHPRAAEC